MRRLLPIVVGAVVALAIAGASPAAPDVEKVYADGHVYEMVGATLHITDSPASCPPRRSI